MNVEQVTKVQNRTVRSDRVTWVFEGSREALRRLGQQLSMAGIFMKPPFAVDDGYRAEFYRPFNG